MERTPKSGELYRHFKGGICQVISIAVHSETGERMVVYQAMYGDFCVYAMPLPEFVSEVDSKKYPQAVQCNRFEKLERREIGRSNESSDYSKVQAKAAGQEMHGNAVEAKNGKTMAAVNAIPPKPRVQSPAESKRGLQMDEGIADTESDYYKRRRRQIEEREHRRGQFRKPQNHESATDELRANPNLLRFLDTDTYEEKFRVLNEIQDDMTDRLIDDIAVVLDVVIPEGPINDRYHQLRNIILTRQKYETNRFR